MKAPETWGAVPTQRAAVWAKQGIYERHVAMELVLQLGCAKGPVEADLKAQVEQVLRFSTGDGNERRRLRKAADNLQAAGLLFEHEGKVYLLYSETVWRKYRHLAPTPVEDAKPAVRKKARPAANDNAASAAHRVLTVYSSCTQTELSLENHSVQGSGEREREEQSAARSVAAAPAAPPPAPVIPLKKAPRAPRKLSPRDVACAEVKAVFNEHYAPRHGGVTSTLAYSLLNPLAGCYLRDGVFQREQFERAVRAFLEDRFWATRGGYGLDVFARHHGRYLSEQAHRLPDERNYNYGF